jgi:hypothetical protein
MEIKQNTLNPFGSREEMGGGTSAWTYGRGVIGSPGAEEPAPPTPDRTLTNAFVRYSAPGWCFGISGSPLTSPTNQDLIVASGFSIVQGDNGPLDINGEWVVDQTVDSNSGTPFAAFLFSSPELRIAIMNAIGGNSSRASEFGTGTILVYEN